MIRPVAHRQPREAAAGIRAHTLKATGSGSLSYIKQPPTAPDSHRKIIKILRIPQRRRQPPRNDDKMPIQSLCCSSSNQVRHLFRMAPRKLTEPAQFYSVYNNHSGYLVRVFTPKIANRSDQTSSPPLAPCIRAHTRPPEAEGNRFRFAVLY